MKGTFSHMPSHTMITQFSSSSSWVRHNFPLKSIICVKSDLSEGGFG